MDVRVFLLPSISKHPGDDEELWVARLCGRRVCIRCGFLADVLAQGLYLGVQVTNL